MRRRTTIVLGAVVIVFLAGVMATTMGSTTQKVTPAEIASGEYEGEQVTVEGVISSEVSMGEAIRFEIAGNQSMANQSISQQDVDLDSLAGVPVVYRGDRTKTMEKGRRAIVEGTVEDGVIRADTVKVQAHRSSA